MHASLPRGAHGLQGLQGLHGLMGSKGKTFKVKDKHDWAHGDQDIPKVNMNSLVSFMLRVSNISLQKSASNDSEDHSEGRERLEHLVGEFRALFCD